MLEKRWCRLCLGRLKVQISCIKFRISLHYFLKCNQISWISLIITEDHEHWWRANIVNNRIIDVESTAVFERSSFKAWSSIGKRSSEYFAEVNVWSSRFVRDCIFERSVSLDSEINTISISSSCNIITCVLYFMCFIIVYLLHYFITNNRPKIQGIISKPSKFRF